MAKNTKTPVMILQELTVKKGYSPPNYELIYSEQGTHVNTFHYRVGVQQQYAVGVGRSKKEAKHDAAKKVLELLSEEGIIEPEESKDLRDITIEGNTLKSPMNCIPTLLELCVEHKIPAAEFKEISAVGLAHCREFTYECRIASITTRATAGSKKHAKQIAARDMLERITNVLPQLREQYEVKQLQLLNSDDHVIEEYNTLKMKPLQINLDAKMEDIENQFVEMMQERGIKEEEVLQFFTLSQNEDTLSSLLQLFDSKFSFDILQEEPLLVVLTVHTDKPLTVIDTGSSMIEAHNSVIEQVFTILKSLMTVNCIN